MEPTKKTTENEINLVENKRISVQKIFQILIVFILGVGVGIVGNKIPKFKSDITEEKNLASQLTPVITSKHTPTILPTIILETTPAIVPTLMPPTISKPEVLSQMISEVTTELNSVLKKQQAEFINPDSLSNMYNIECEYNFSNENITGNQQWAKEILTLFPNSTVTSTCKNLNNNQVIVISYPNGSGKIVTFTLSLIDNNQVIKELMLGEHLVTNGTCGPTPDSRKIYWFQGNLIMLSCTPHKYIADLQNNQLKLIEYEFDVYSKDENWSVNVNLNKSKFH